MSGNNGGKEMNPECGAQRAPASEILPVLYRNDALIAVHKPSGLLVHRTMIDRHETRFAVQIVRDQIGQTVFPVHRLDKGTSGVLLFALSRDAARLLGAAFATHALTRRYLAIVRGHPPATLRIDHPLQRPRDEYAEPGSASRDSGDDCDRACDGQALAQDAVTDLRTLATAELPIPVDRYPTSRYALVELCPQTGRRHQLRRHMKHVAHPIIGDATYGKGIHNRMFKQHLHSHRLLLACTQMTLDDPLSGQPLTLSAPPAEDFVAAMRALGWPAEAAER